MGKINLLRSFLDLVLIILSSLISLFFLTGGGDLKTRIGKIEFSSLDVWMMAWILLFWIRNRFFGSESNPITPFIYKILRWMSQPKRSVYRTLVFLSIVCGTLFVAHIFKHWNMGTASFDVTFLHQSLFYPFPLQDSPPLKCDICTNKSYFSEHFAPTLYAFAPLTAWIHLDELIFFIQTLLIFIPLLLGLKYGPLRNKKQFWLIATFILICHPGLRYHLTWDFREDSLAFASLIGACVSLYRKRFFLYGMFILLSVMSKENVGFVTLFFAFPIYLDSRLKLKSKQKFIFSLISIMISLFWIIFTFKFVIPHYSPGTHNISSRLPGIGKTPLEVVLYLLTHPFYFIQFILQKFLKIKVIKYVFLLIAPWMFLIFRKSKKMKFTSFPMKSLRQCAWFIPAVPGILMNGLSSVENQLSFQFHYHLIILPFLIMAVWITMKDLVDHPKWISQKWFVFVICALCFSGRWPVRELTQNFPKIESFKNSFTLRTLENDGAIASTDRALAQLSYFKQLQFINFPKQTISSDGLKNWNILAIENSNWNTVQYIALDLATNPSESISWLKVFVTQAPFHGWKLIKESSNHEIQVFKKFIF